jgi:hypothetical protein
MSISITILADKVVHWRHVEGVLCNRLISHSMNSHANARLNAVRLRRLVLRHNLGAELLAKRTALTVFSLQVAEPLLVRCSRPRWVYKIYTAASGVRPIHTICCVRLLCAMSTLLSGACPLACSSAPCCRPHSQSHLSSSPVIPAATVPVRRYHCVRSGDMIHVDIKQQARFDRVAHLIIDDRRISRLADAGY